MLGLKLNHVRKSGHWHLRSLASRLCSTAGQAYLLNKQPSSALLTLCQGNPPFPSQRAGNEEIVSMTWRHNTTAVYSLQWRHNGHGSVSNHQHHDFLLNRLFRRRSKKTLKPRVTGLCAGNSPGTGEFPTQMARNAENVSIWWRHHVRSC